MMVIYSKLKLVYIRKNTLREKFTIIDGKGEVCMKKLSLLVLSCILLFGLYGCGKDTIPTREVSSDLYSAKEIEQAITTITKEFKKEWKGCTLTEIYYAGDEVSLEHQDWAERNNAEEVIVLSSSFEVDESGGDGSLNPNSTYTDWMWILVRTDNGKWIHVDHGY